MRKFLLAVCGVVACIVVAAILLTGSHDSKIENPSNGDTSHDSDSTHYPASLVVDDSDQTGTSMTAKALNVAPGAIVCADYQTVGVVFDMYSNYWQEHAQDALTHGQSKLIRGQAAPEPDPVSYGCALIPPGTEMRFHAGNVVPVVTVRMPDGKTIKGVTLPAMMASQAEVQAAADAENFRTTIMGTRADFQRLLPTLARPAANLRWFQHEDLSILVMPFGPCAVLQVSGSGYVVREIDPPNAFGPFSTKDEAESQAETICNGFYQGMVQDPNARMGPNSPAERILWFPPDSEDSTSKGPEADTGDGKN